MHKNSKIFLFITITLCLTFSLSACSSADDEPANESKSTTTQGSNKTKSGNSSGVASELIGTWNADAADVLAANTANLGGTPGLDCSGLVSLTFTENASSGGGNVSCTVPQANIEVTGEVSWNCTSTTNSNVLTNKDCQHSGTVAYGSQEIPIPEIISNGDAKYKIDGDTLTLTFDEESVGKVIQTYTRA